MCKSMQKKTFYEFRFWLCIFLLNKIPKNIKNENCNKIRMDGERLGFCLLSLCVLGQMSVAPIYVQT
jgi:hypothetical protein